MKSTPASPLPVDETTSAVLRTLLYFHLFRYPLRMEEVRKTAGVKGLTPSRTEQTLKELVYKGVIRTLEGYYFMGEDESLVAQRKTGNLRAEKFLKIARKKARIMGHFPFVKAVMISGSLSKGVIKPDGDIDYFLVTEPGRLWVARTLLILYKKLFLFNSHEYWCVNYFVDTDHLEIEDQNLFTATELKWLLPVWNPELYKKVMAANTWANQWFPNYAPRPAQQCAPYRRSWIKKLSESLLGGGLGTKFDRWCMARTMRRWEKKFSHFDPATFEITLRSRQYVSKHHPSDFQRQVKKRLAEEVAKVEAQLGQPLHHPDFFSSPPLPNPSPASASDTIVRSQVSGS